VGWESGKIKKTQIINGLGKERGIFQSCIKRQFTSKTIPFMLDQENGSHSFLTKVKGCKMERLEASTK